MTKSIRLITIHDDGEVEWTPERMSETIEGGPPAIQRFMIQLLNTPGTYIEKAQFGGGIPKLMFISRGTPLSDVKVKVADKIQRVEQLLPQTEPEKTDHTITGVDLMNIERQPERGLSLTVRLHFYGSTPFNLTLPFNTNGSQ